MIKILMILAISALPAIAGVRGFTATGFIGHENKRDAEKESRHSIYQANK